MGKSALANIASTAARGLASVSMATTVDQLLNMSIQPSLLGTPAMSDNTELDYINNQLVPAMVVLDLACAASNTVESSNQLLDQALKRLPGDVKRSLEEQTIKKREQFKDGGVSAPDVVIGSLPFPLKGIVGFLQNSAALLGQLTTSQKQLKDTSFHGTQSASRNRLVQTVSGLNSLLSQGILSLDPDALRKTFAFDDELKALVYKVLLKKYIYGIFVIKGFVLNMHCISVSLLKLKAK